MRYQKNIFKFILGISFLIALCISTFAQKYQQKYDALVYESDKNNSLQNVDKVSSSRNSSDFMMISLNVNNRNLLYKQTSNQKYLDENIQIIKNIRNSAILNHNGDYIWLAKTNDNYTNNKEVQIYEAYLVKYIAEFCFLGKELNYDYSSELDLVKNIFFKWYNKSKMNYGDFTGLITGRTHMGSHWALTAQYLLKVDEDKENQLIYKSLIDQYNDLLKNNFKLTKDNAYFWNSTYDTLIGNMTKPKAEIVQDIAHANHVVLYIISAYELGDTSWNYEDLQRLINSIKYITYDSQTNRFYDQFDKKNPLDQSLKNTGRRQSDGWMKLIKYDQSLYNLYNKFYEGNSEITDKSIYNTQFYIQMLLNQ